MAPWMDAIWTLVRVLGMVGGVMAVGALALVVFVDVWAKKFTLGKFCCYFIQQKHLFSRLLREDSGKVFLGRRDEKEEYVLSSEKQFWVWWPSGIPQALQVAVRAHLYVRFNPEPYDPEKLETLITSKSLRIISDEAMLKTAWRDVRESTQGRVGAGGALPQWVVIVLIAAATLSGGTMYMVMQLQRNVTTLMKLFGG